MTKEQRKNGSRGGKSKPAKAMPRPSKKARLETMLSRPRSDSRSIGEGTLLAIALSAGGDFATTQSRCRRFARPPREDANLPDRCSGMSGKSIHDYPKRLREIMSMDRAACAKELAAMPGLTVPPRLRAESLRLLLAYETQARALGGLTAGERRMLRAAASSKPVGDVTAQASPGTLFVREWSGRAYRVEVTDNGYVLDGTTYASLSAVAKRITGTAWSGPRFFGLTGKRSA